MKSKPYLIVGIDPGITTGVCALNLNGDIINAYSSKKMGMKKIISWIENIGTPILVACDVNKPPYLVKKLSMFFKSKFFHPKHDLKVGEKQKITETINSKLEDDHQRDSCAAALLAFKKYKKLFHKVDITLEKMGKTEKSDEVKRKIIFGEAKNIKDALKEKPEEINLQKKKRVKYLEAESKLTKLKRELTGTKNILENLKDNLNSLKKENLKLKKELSSKKSSKELIDLAKKRKEVISILEKRIVKLRSMINSLKEENKRLILEQNIVKKYDCFIIKQVKKLDVNEISKIKNLFGSILMADKLTIPGKDVIKLLKRKNVKIIFYNKNDGPSNILRSMGFEVFRIKGREMKEEGGIRFIEKRELKKLRDNSNLIERIIEEYKSKRQ